MLLLDLSLESAAENLALDEALLQEAESRDEPLEVLRLWEFAGSVVVVGRGSRVENEVEVALCKDQGVQILRRSSGGAAIVAGPGCLMYSTVLSYERRPDLRSIEKTHRFVLGQVLSAVQTHFPQATQRGTSDLALDQYKFSGNSLRCRRTHLLYHGTLLYDLPASGIQQYLKMPPRQPDYREGREHERFVRNLPVQANQLRQAVIDQWPIEGTLADWPRELTQRLAAEKYSSDDWNFRL